MLHSDKVNHPFIPSVITRRLKSTSVNFPHTLKVSKCVLSGIAKHMRLGRQEDAHEFLRYTVDGFQKSCLAGYPP